VHTRRPIFVIWLCAAGALAALAPGAAAQDATGSLGVNTGLLQVTLNLLLVLAAIVLLAWLFRRVQGFGQPAAGSIRVAATLPLGPKERILLLEIGSEQILVGASAAGLRTLHVLAEPVATTAPEGTASFRDKLHAALGRTTP
jgi:flagellar protein FliO/FliZ